MAVELEGVDVVHEVFGVEVPCAVEVAARADLYERGAGRRFAGRPTDRS
jgi:hypothetical protein